MIPPTVGRKVWYSPTAADADFSTKLGEQPFDATIVYVHSDRRVNLACFNHRGYPLLRQGVTLLQDEDAPTPGGGHCSWMPYQIGQAKK